MFVSGGYMADGASSPRLSSFRKFLKEKVLIPALVFVIGIVLLDPLKSWWLGPKTYKVYFVGKLDDPEIKRVFLGVKQESDSVKLKIEDVEIELEREDDNGDSATAKKIATELVKRPDTLIVIGHVLSEQTVRALPIYMSGNPPVPVIATTETYPELAQDVPACTSQPTPESYCPFLQMSPSDVDQARRAVEFALSKGKKSFLIASELNEENKVYSASLKKYYQQFLQSSRSVKNSIQPATFTDVPRQHIPDINSIKAADPDCILYAGELNSAIPLLKAVRNGFDPSKAPMVILSDSAVNEDFFANRYPELVGSYATYQLSDTEYRSPVNVYGRDAFSIVSSLIKGANEQLEVSGGWMYSLRRVLQMHRAADVRRALKAVMLQRELSAQSYLGATSTRYSFSAHKRTNGYFHVWQVTDKGAVDVDCSDNEPCTHHFE
jgi:hypothetical protein